MISARNSKSIAEQSNLFINNRKQMTHNKLSQKDN